MPVNYKLYPADWKTRIVPLVTIRSGNKCELCGLPNHTWLKSIVVKKYRGKKLVYRREWRACYEQHTTFKPVQVILTVMHLDHDAHNHCIKLDRLRHACQECHLRYDAYEKAKNRLKQLATLRG